MEALTDQEIEHLASLLLMGDAANQKLAKTLLKPHYREALPRMHDPALMHWLLCPNDPTFNAWVEEALSPPPREKHPFYPLAQAYWLAEQTVQSWETLAKLLPDWEAQASYFECNARHHHAYWLLYGELRGRDMAQPAYRALVLLYLMRKVVTFSERYTIPRRYQLLLSWITLLRECQPTGYVDEVVNAYEQAYRLRANPEPLCAAGQFYEQEVGDLDQALNYYQRCRSIYSEHVPAFAAEAQIRYQKGDHAKAQTLVLQALEGIEEEDGLYQAEEHSNLYTLLGHLTWVQTQDAASAAAHYEQALAIVPTNCDALTGWANLLIQQPNGWAQIEALFKEALDHGQDEQAIHQSWGDFCEQHQRLEAALAIYKRGEAQCKSADFSKRIQRVTTLLNHCDHGADS